LLFDAKKKQYIFIRDKLPWFVVFLIDRKSSFLKAPFDGKRNNAGKSKAAAET
jgi:hypothetical protein